MKKRLFIIVIAFCISFLSMAALSIFSLERFNIYANYSALMAHSGTVIDNIYQAELHLRDIDKAERGYMITRDTLYMPLLNNAITNIYGDLQNISYLTADNKIQLKNLTILKASVAIRVAKARDNIDYLDTAKDFNLNKYHDSRKLMEECSEKLNEIHNIENILRTERLNGEHTYLNITANSLKYLLVIFLVITLFLFGVIIKELRGRIGYQEELQAKVIDLGRSHGELQEIAYAASHDLQEPLRKIQVFSNILLYQKTEVLSEDIKSRLIRINNSANRMQVLITDLMSLTTLTKVNEAKTITDLNLLVSCVIADTESKIKEKNASIEVMLLPVINGYDNQLRLLFRALLDNALKFNRHDVKPVIAITYEFITGIGLSDINPNLINKKFHCITIADNGIGFDNKFINKIFGIFQRLHAQQSEYEGKGIGLAICQRVMANHEGYITAEGVLNIGAKFKLFFPLQKLHGHF